jgi:hypothetical protein
MSFLHLNFILVIAQLNEYSRSTVSENRAFGFPRTVSAGGLGIDIDKDFYSVSPIDGDRQKVKQFFMNNGIIGSYLEGGIFEQIFGGEAVSTIHILNKANQEGIKVYQINSANAADVLPKLQYNTLKKQSLQNLIDSGKEITIPEKKVTISGWNGTGYIVLEPEDGTGAYMIDGGLAGGFFKAILLSLALFLIAMAFCIIGSSLALPMVTAWLISVVLMPIYGVLEDVFIVIINGVMLPLIAMVAAAICTAALAGTIGMVITIVGFCIGVIYATEWLVNKFSLFNGGMNEFNNIC